MGSIPALAVTLLMLSAAPVCAQTPAEGRAHQERAIALMRAGQLAAAREEFLTAIRLAEEAGDLAHLGVLLHQLGSIAFEREGEAAARAVWDRALAVFRTLNDEQWWLRVLVDRVRVTPPGPEKEALIAQGLAGARALGHALLEAAFLQRLGTQQMWDGRYIDAVVSLRAAIDRFESGGRPEGVADAILPLARLYERHGRADLAREARLRGAAIFTRLGSLENHARARSQLASAEGARGRLAAAIRLQREAIAIARKTEGRRLADQLELQLAWWLLATRQPEAALRLMQERSQTGDPMVMGLAHHPLAEAYLAVGRFGEALEAIERALPFAIEPSARPELLAVRAKALVGMGNRDAALTDVREAMAITERMRAGLIPLDSMKQGIAEITRDLFDLAITLSADQGQASEALSIAERARSRAFLDLLASRRDRDALDAVIQGTPATTTEIPSAAQGDVFTSTDYAELARRTRSTILVYWTGPTRSLVWVIQPSGEIHMANIAAGTRRMSALVAGTQPAAADGTRGAKVKVSPPKPLVTAVLDVSTRRTHWRTLHRVLIEPVAQWLPSEHGAPLTIIPHGSLTQLSFAALRDARGRYLVERFAVHYLPAGAAIGQAPTRSSPRVLLVGTPNRFPRQPGLRLDSLPGARAEVRAVARRFSPQLSDVFIGAAAGERAIRDVLPHAGLIHVATHAVSDDRQPLEAFLALEPGPTGGDDDGRLTIVEIYQLRFSARLVVLSACRTASGRTAGDGVAGFARAFLSAGVGTVVGGLWEVPDLTSAALMRDFYAGLERGSAQALRHAQLKLLSALRGGKITVAAGAERAVIPEDPALWAGYIVLGLP